MARKPITINWKYILKHGDLSIRDSDGHPVARIYGTKGVLRLYDDPRFSLIHEPKDGEVQQYRFRGLTSNEEQKAGKRENTGVIDAFVDSVITGKRSPIDAEEALKAMRVIFAALESAQTGRRIMVHHD